MDQVPFAAEYISTHLATHQKWLQSNDLRSRDGLWFEHQGLIRGMTFTNENFAGVELYDCMFDNVTFEICDLATSIFSGSTFIDCHFKRCNLFKAEFNNTTFRSTTFSDCWIRRTEFISADMSGTHFKNCMFRRPLFANTDLTNILVEHSNMTEIRLGNIKLRGARFSEISRLDFAMFQEVNLGMDYVQTYNSDEAIAALTAIGQLEPVMNFGKLGG